ncbi:MULTISPECIES: DivIVA domain-containing protein [Rathayibacter]|uniref:Cell wall synthesis protein Wag31 n=2 Tax=Rathayibacter festucae TaxID=110937 RepID=A0A3Q9UY91_9MICO|nr:MULTISPECIES: DivIVA domain-containing protein [Rathayibacter]AZZ52152.1 cell division protein [Rathayibacter festucae DSM 15932]MCJ1674225.1 DivIVA domain-containing protein [Rathayibacter sp. VKM Ac-2929]MCJ1684506.1 DivIVA domain-containing protein [Rathayibacter sp. VKM Ac-2928]MCJ1689543.1 DivIVA domain-containing protein [Rathayibacter sp. VKM Ac-2927]MCJ1700677.1 DivIVA domain-containing protein [Rathayibacter festucae]
MALTPEDVVNKRFQPTKFREGYDQDEVDDFLDEVVVELRRLNQENEELRQRLSSGDSRPMDAPVASTPAPAPVVDETPAPEPEPEPEPEPTPAPAQAAPAASQSAPVDEAESSSGLLQLARRLHEEHVREGADKRDALVAEGRATAARIVAEAEAKQRAQVAKLEEERATVEHRIDELRTFEREYRQKLKSYIEGQLRDLDTQPVSAESSSFPGFGA